MTYGQRATYTSRGLGVGFYVVEPAEVTRAKKLIDRFTKAEALRQCQQTKRNEALIRKAREAVYFAEPKKALAIIQQCEKMLKGCGE